MAFDTVKMAKLKNKQTNNNNNNNKHHCTAITLDKTPTRKCTIVLSQFVTREQPHI